MSDQPMGDEFASYDAAYVLGALSPEDRERYEEHLAECASCRASVDQISDLPPLLAAVPLAEVFDAPDPDPPPRLLPNLLASARRERLRSHWLMGGAAAGAAAIAAAIVLIALLVIAPALTPARSPAPVAMSPVAAAPIHVDAVLADKAWGTQVTLRCTYGSASAYSPGSYVLVAVDRDGGTQQVAAWRAVPDRVSTVIASTSLHRADISALQVRTPTGTPVLQLRL
jgi:anti-sigma factor RsiW